MRRFHSYGPVDYRHHFCVERHELVETCLRQLIGIPNEYGHYFTIWAPRQTGKTWLMRRVREEISERYAEQFTVYSFSMGNLRGMNYVPSDDPNDLPLPKMLRDILETELPGNPSIRVWKDFNMLFAKESGLWDRPLILLIDEADTAPPALLDLIVGRFRELYLNRERHWLHGLALIGVRAVLGIESRRGSPFNIQRSLHVPNLTCDEVTELYRQYQNESGQAIEPEVVAHIYESTRGQPGLVSWFGELLTEKYNRQPDQPIGPEQWTLVRHVARTREPNNTLLNLIAKARDPEYRNILLKLFTTSDIPFFFHHPLHSYLYLHGIIEPETVTEPDGTLNDVCRFSSPFIQQCLYDALSHELIGDGMPMLALDPLDDLADVFAANMLDMPALLRRYQDYLARLKTKGINPWQGQPRRTTDLHLTEAVGHFHLFAWLRNALGSRCVVSPEFPTGNGKIDLHLRCGKQRGIIEVKSFVNAYQAKTARQQAADYAAQLGLDRVTIAMFTPVDDESVLEKLSGQETLLGVQVTMVAIGWV